MEKYFLFNMIFFNKNKIFVTTYFA